MLWTRLCIAYDHSHHPPQIAISVDTDALTATVQIYLNLPIVGLLLSQAMGALKLNSNIEVDFNVAPGVGYRRYQGGYKQRCPRVLGLHLSWSETKGSHVVFHI